MKLIEKKEEHQQVLRPPRTALVIFGATGDLTTRKLIPALCNLAQDGYLPQDFIVIGASRQKLSDQEFRDRVFKGVKEFSRRPITDQVWERFSKNVYYQAVGFSALEDFINLRTRLEELGQQCAESLNYLYYLATSPEFFSAIATHLKQAGLVEPVQSTKRTTSIVIEKPFGRDLESARALNHDLTQSFDERQIFRIDHYLGKETVQNILVFRFANGIFEPLWNHKYIDHIQISVAETVGVGSRAGYFDQTGILRDIVQNHVLQVLSLLCIEPPISLDADSIRDEKTKVLKCIRRYTREEARANSVRAQYSAGHIDAKAVPAYKDEKGVAKGSSADTFVALKLAIDNWRWSGVPIYVRAGKRLPKRISEITVFFKQVPDTLFRGLEGCELEQNVLAIQIQPEEGISLKVSSKPPGPRMRVSPVVMEFNYGNSYGVPSPEAYERLLLDAMKGDATLFTRNDEIEEAWDLLAPIFDLWENFSKDSESAIVHDYQAGSWGPKAAADLLRVQGHRWRRL